MSPSSFGTPGRTPSSHGRVNGGGRTARPLAGRPVKIDLTGVARGGGDPFAALGGEADAGNGAAQVMGEMLDRAATQVAMLRRAVEDAAGADAVVRRHAAELAQRMAQGQQFAAEFDQRLARAGQAAGVVEKAAVALGAMEGVIAQMRGAQEAITRSFDAKMRAQQESMEGRIAEQERFFVSRMQAQQEMFERRIADMSEGFERAMEGAGAEATRARDRFESTLEEHRKSLMAAIETACAGADRHVAQTQARASLVLDGVADRMDVLEQQISRMGGAAQEQVDRLCARAAEVLGHDPRSNFESTPRMGSLAEAVQRADAMITGVDDASLRIAAARADAEAMVSRLTGMLAETERATSEHGPRLEGLREAIERAIDEGDEMKRTLEEATRKQAEAVEKAGEASGLLARQREDLGAMAEAGRYHVEQCKAADATLRASIDAAAAKSEELRAAMDEVTANAARMVGFAREAAALVEKARGKGEVGRRKGEVGKEGSRGVEE